MSSPTGLSGDYPTWFNSEGQESNYDKRSDDEGTEPEGVAVGFVNGKRLTFIGLERMGRIMVYDIPESMTFQIPRLPSSQLTY